MIILIHSQVQLIFKLIWIPFSWCFLFYVYLMYVATWRHSMDIMSNWLTNPVLDIKEEKLQMPEVFLHEMKSKD